MSGEAGPDHQVIHQPKKKFLSRFFPKPKDPAPLLPQLRKLPPSARAHPTAAVPEAPRHPEHEQHSVTEESTREIRPDVYGEVTLKEGETVLAPLDRLESLLLGDDASVRIEPQGDTYVATRETRDGHPVPGAEPVVLERDKPLLVGRAVPGSEPGLAVPVSGVSRKHVKITLSQDGTHLVVTDLHSTYGTGVWLRLQPRGEQQDPRATEPHVLEGFGQFAALESMGGNAGSNRRGINAVFDPNTGGFRFTNAEVASSNHVIFREISPTVENYVPGAPFPPTLIEQVFAKPDVRDRYQQASYMSLETRATQHNAAKILEYLRAGGDPTVLPRTPLMPNLSRLRAAAEAS